MKSLLSLIILGFSLSDSAGTSPRLEASAIYDGHGTEGPLLYYDGVNTFKADISFSVNNNLPNPATLILSCVMRKSVSKKLSHFKHNEVFVQKHVFEIAGNTELEKTQKFAFSVQINEHSGFKGHMQCSADLSFENEYGRNLHKTMMLKNPPRIYVYSVSVKGYWSEWSSEDLRCRVTCGNGETYKTRTCTRPAPVGNGEDCSGNSTEGCSTRVCLAEPSLITEESLNWIAQWLPDVTFKRIYRSTEDGLNKNAFLMAAEVQPPTIVLGKDSNTGVYYGGYTTLSWLSSVLRKYDENAFIFKINCTGNGNCTASQFMFGGTPSDKNIVNGALPSFTSQLDFNGNKECVAGVLYGLGYENLGCSGNWDIIEAYQVK